MRVLDYRFVALSHTDSGAAGAAILNLSDDCDWMPQSSI